jgi:hypothetical protein
MTREYAKELLKEHGHNADNVTVNLVSTEGVWRSLDTIKGDGKCKFEAYTIKQLKDIAND